MILQTIILPFQLSIQTDQKMEIKLLLLLYMVEENTALVFQIKSLSLQQNINSNSFSAYSHREISCKTVYYLFRFIVVFAVVRKVLVKCHQLLLNHCDIVMCWIPGKVGIKGNARADQAAKNSLDRPIDSHKIPYSDFKPHIWKYICSLWETQWDSRF